MSNRTYKIDSFGSIQIDPMFSWSYRLYLDCLFHGRKVVRPISTGYIYPLNIIQIALSKHRGTERYPADKIDPLEKGVTHSGQPSTELYHDNQRNPFVSSTEFSNPVFQLDYHFGQKYPSTNNGVIDGQRIYELTQQLINQTSNAFWDGYITSRATHYQPDPYSRFQLYCAVREVFAENYEKCKNEYKVPGG